MNLSFLEPAEEELKRAISYYEEQKQGLGQQFSQEIQDTLKRITDAPTNWPKLSKSTWRCRTKRFPYGIIYSVREDDILVIAIMHLHRKPGYWMGRL